ncbi:hypothetical protein ACTFIV_005444 [Dictyostelium citrinum]
MDLFNKLPNEVYCKISSFSNLVSQNQSVYIGDYQIPYKDIRSSYSSVPLIGSIHFLRVHQLERLPRSDNVNNIKFHRSSEFQRFHDLNGREYTIKKFTNRDFNGQNVILIETLMTTDNLTKIYLRHFVVSEIVNQYPLSSIKIKNDQNDEINVEFVGLVGPTGGNDTSLEENNPSFQVLNNEEL